MRLKDWIKNNNGFSLVEVMLALAILALVTLPLINYFTYSSLQTIDGRERQTATMAAEDVVEELRGYSNYEQIEQLTATSTPIPSGTPSPSAVPVSPSAWKADSSPVPDYTSSPSASPAPIDLMRDVEMNGFQYVAKVHFDFDTYDSATRTVSGAAVSSQYNDYYIPTPEEVHSEHNVVAAEDDEVDSAVSEIYTDLMSSGSVSATAAPSSTSLPVADSDSYIVKVYYRYTYDRDANAADFSTASDKMEFIKSKVKRTVCIYIKKMSDDNPEPASASGTGVIEKDVTLEETEISKDKLKNIFVFYKPAWDSNTENFYVKFGTGIGEDDVEKLGFYLTYQDMSVLYPGESPQPGVSSAPDASSIGTYKLRLTGDTTLASHARFYSNLNRYDPDNSVPTEGFTLEKTDAGKWDSYVTKKQKKRIAKMYVDIFKRDETVFSAENALAHMESTLAE